MFRSEGAVGQEQCIPQSDIHHFDLRRSTEQLRVGQDPYKTFVAGDPQSTGGIDGHGVELPLNVLQSQGGRQVGPARSSGIQGQPPHAAHDQQVV